MSVAHSKWSKLFNLQVQIAEWLYFLRERRTRVDRASSEVPVPPTAELIMAEGGAP
jgi:hypothetical protein